MGAVRVFAFVLAVLSMAEGDAFTALACVAVAVLGRPEGDRADS